MADCYVWDFTLPRLDLDPNILKDNLRKNCKKYSFQLEKGESGYEHWQGRISLIKKKSLKALINSFSVYTHWAKAHFSPTSSNAKGDMFYVIKDDTRIDGPWTEKDEIKVITTQMKLFNQWGLLPWQEKAKEICQEFCLRTIDLIYDPNGNAGKSLFSEHMEYEGLAEEIPPFRMMDDIFQWVATRPIKSAYIVDMPRGMKKDKLGDFYSGIEVIKNGVAYDKRYTAKKIRFNRPRVFVFTNTLPALDLMSKDRWSIWTIIKNDLVKWDELLENKYS
jgi:hypothetical protein